MFLAHQDDMGVLMLYPRRRRQVLRILLLALFISYYSSYLHQTLRMMHMDLDMDLTDLDAESWPKTFGFWSRLKF